MKVNFNEPRDNQQREDEFLRLIKEAQKHPVIYTSEQTVEFISQKINFGYPKCLPYSGRGRKSRNNQYDKAYERRKGFYHRQVRLPASGAKGRLSIGEASLKGIKTIAEELTLQKTPQRQRVSRLFKHIEDNQITLLQHDRKTLYISLKKLNYLPSN